MPDIELLPLTTPRLTLRPLRESDAPILIAYRNDPAVARYQDWPLPYTATMARRVIEASASARSPRPAEWVQIGIDHDGELIGDAAVGLDGTGKLATIGYTLRADRQGRGFATEAVGALIDGLFAAGIHRVAATLDPAERGVRDAPGAARLPVRGASHGCGVRAWRMGG